MGSTTFFFSLVIRVGNVSPACWANSTNPELGLGWASKMAS